MPKYVRTDSAETGFEVPCVTAHEFVDAEARQRATMPRREDGSIGYRSRFTREGDKQIVPARLAPRPSEALREHAALQVRAQFILDVAGKPTVVVLASVGEEALQVLAYQAVKNGLGRATREVRGGKRGHEADPFADRVPRGGCEIPPACEAPALSRTALKVAADTSASRGVAPHHQPSGGERTARYAATSTG